MEHAVTATSRNEVGSSAVKRLRKAGQIPGVVYGIGDPMPVKLDGHRLQLDLENDSFYSSVLKLEIGDKEQAVLLREVQFHPVNGKVLHVDFQAVREDEEISATVSIHYLDAENAPGVKLGHGIFSTTTNDLQVHCLPKDLPEFIEVNVGHMELNQSIHLEEISAPLGVKFDAITRGENPALATIVPPQAEEEETPAAADVADGAEPTAAGEEQSAEGSGKESSDE